MIKTYRKTSTEQYEIEVRMEPMERRWSESDYVLPLEPRSRPGQIEDGAGRLIHPACHFVRSLDVPAPALRSRATPAAIEDDTEAAYNVKSSLMSFVSGVSAQNKSDALNSVLLAELAANKKFDKFKQTDDWYDFYTKVLSNIGWASESFQFSEFQLSGSTVQVDQILVDVMAAALTQNEMALMKAALDAQKKLAETDHRFVVWEQETHTDSQGNFRIGIGAEIGGVFTMKIGAFKFTTTQTDTHLFGIRWSASTDKIFSADQQVTLDTGVYDKVRDDIVTKLGNNAVNFVLSLDI